MIHCDNLVASAIAYPEHSICQRLNFYMARIHPIPPIRQPRNREWPRVSLLIDCDRVSLEHVERVPRK